MSDATKVQLDADETTKIESARTAGTQFQKVAAVGDSAIGDFLSREQEVNSIFSAGKLEKIGTCREKNEAGQTSLAMACDNKECCTIDEYKADADSCTTECSCTYTEERTRTEIEEHPVLIRGVPVLSQFNAGGGSTYKPIGCAAIALVELGLYYGSWGWSNLLASSGKTDWEQQAYEAADFLRTWVRRNQSPTLMSTVQAGIEDFFDDAGYTASVTYVEVTDDEDEQDAAWGRITHSIDEGRPVYIGFDSNGEHEGGGIGGGGDNFGFIDHYALIVGYDDTGSTRKIHVNMGWGYFEEATACDDGACLTLKEGVAVYDWEIGRGKVFLWMVHLDASEKTVADEQCPLHSFYSYFTPTEVVAKDGGDRYLGATYYKDTTPVLRTLIRGSDCALLGGSQVVGEETYDYTFTETEVSCANRYDLYDNWLSDDYVPEGFDSLDVDILDKLDP